MYAGIIDPSLANLPVKGEERAQPPQRPGVGRRIPVKRPEASISHPQRAAWVATWLTGNEVNRTPEGVIGVDGGIVDTVIDLNAGSVIQGERDGVPVRRLIGSTAIEHVV